MKTTRTSMARLFPAVALVATLLALATPTPARAATECTGFLSEVTVNDKLVVPEGVTCTLNHPVVTGKVQVEEGATLEIFGGEVRGKVEAEGYVRLIINGAEIGGNVDATGGGVTSISGSRIGGSVEVTGIGGQGFVHVIHTRIRGHLRVEENQVDDFIQIHNTSVGGALTIGGNTVGDAEGTRIFSNTVSGTLTFDDNTAVTGFNSIYGNVIGNSLACEGNDPAPILIVAIPNEAAGGKEGQCASL